MNARDMIDNELERWPQLVFAVLFGSRATEQARPDSDWDVGLYFSPDLPADDRFRICQQIAGGLAPAVPIDLTILNEAPPLLAHRALMGIRILDRDPGAYVRFFVKTVGMALDMGPMMQLHARARRARMGASADG